MLFDCDYFILLYIMDFLFDNQQCILSIKDKYSYFSFKYSCIYFYALLKKDCDIFFIYKPLNRNLKTLCECHKHCDKNKNDIYIINLLNSRKIKKNLFLGKIQFDTINDCIKVYPYFKDLNYKITNVNNMLYISGKNEQVFSFI